MSKDRFLKLDELWRPRIGDAPCTMKPESKVKYDLFLSKVWVPLCRQNAHSETDNIIYILCWQILLKQYFIAIDSIRIGSFIVYVFAVCRTNRKSVITRVFLKIYIL